MSDFAFNPAEEEGSKFKLLPPGEYLAEIVATEIRQPQNADGYMLCLTWRVCEGPLENRQIFENLCYQHSNMQAQQIARRKIKDICEALGITAPITDPEVFTFKPMRVRVGIKTDRTGQYDDANTIKRVLIGDDQKAAPSAPPPSSPASKPKAISSAGMRTTPPWNPKSV